MAKGRMPNNSGGGKKGKGPKKGEGGKKKVASKMFDKTGLKPTRKQITRDGESFTQTFWTSVKQDVGGISKKAAPESASQKGGVAPTTPQSQSKNLALNHLQNIESINGKLDAKPEVRQSMLDQLSTARERALQSGSQPHLDAIERSMAMLGGDLSKFYQGSDLASRMKSVVKLKDPNTALLHTETMNKVLQDHGITSDMVRNPNSGAMESAMKVRDTSQQPGAANTLKTSDMQQAQKAASNDSTGGTAPTTPTAAATPTTPPKNDAELVDAAAKFIAKNGQAGLDAITSGKKPEGMDDAVFNRAVEIMTGKSSQGTSQQPAQAKAEPTATTQKAPAADAVKTEKDRVQAQIEALTGLITKVQKLLTPSQRAKAEKEIAKGKESLKTKVNPEAAKAATERANVEKDLAAKKASGEKLTKEDKKAKERVSRQDRRKAVNKVKAEGKLQDTEAMFNNNEAQRFLSGKLSADEIETVTVSHSSGDHSISYQKGRGFHFDPVKGEMTMARVSGGSQELPHADARGEDTVSHFPVAITNKQTGKTTIVGYNGKQADKGHVRLTSAAGGGNMSISKLIGGKALFKLNKSYARAADRIRKSIEGHGKKGTTVDVPIIGTDGSTIGTKAVPVVTDHTGNTADTNLAQPQGVDSLRTAADLTPRGAKILSKTGYQKVSDLKNGIRTYFDHTGQLAPELRLTGDQTMDAPKGSAAHKRITSHASRVKKAMDKQKEDLKRLGREFISKLDDTVSDSDKIRMYDEFVATKKKESGDPAHLSMSASLGHTRRTMHDSLKKNAGLHAQLTTMAAEGRATALQSAGDALVSGAAVLSREGRSADGKTKTDIAGLGDVGMELKARRDAANARLLKSGEKVRKPRESTGSRKTRTTEGKSTKAASKDTVRKAGLTSEQAAALPKNPTESDVAFIKSNDMSNEVNTADTGQSGTDLSLFSDMAGDGRAVHKPEGHEVKTFGLDAGTSRPRRENTSNAIGNVLGLAGEGKRVPLSKWGADSQGRQGVTQQRWEGMERMHDNLPGDIEISRMTPEQQQKIAKDTNDLITSTNVDDLGAMQAFDEITGQQDRHTGNIGVVDDSSSSSGKRMVLYDQGLTLGNSGGNLPDHDRTLISHLVTQLGVAKPISDGNGGQRTILSSEARDHMAKAMVSNGYRQAYETAHSQKATILGTARANGLKGAELASLEARIDTGYQMTRPDADGGPSAEHTQWAYETTRIGVGNTEARTEFHRRNFGRNA